MLGTVGLGSVMGTVGLGSVMGTVGLGTAMGTDLLWYWRHTTGTKTASPRPHIIPFHIRYSITAMTC